MFRYILAILFCISNAPASAQALPPLVDKVEFFGDILAVVAFCNLIQTVDQYELSAGMRHFGISSADRVAMEASRDKHYATFRRENATPAKHQEFCVKSMRHSFLVKVQRSGVPSHVGSDHRRQPEKIEFFGDILANMVFCKIPVNSDKWGAFMFNMGVKSESMAALGEHATKTQKAIAAEYGTSQGAAEMCKETRANPAVQRFMTQ